MTVLDQGLAQAISETSALGIASPLQGAKHGISRERNRVAILHYVLVVAGDS
jgi:hypothetical protein